MFNKKYSLMFVLLLSFLVAIVTASTFIDNQEPDFNSGTYNWTFYNSSGFIQLNESRLNGTFTSQIFNSGGNSQWNNLSWFTEVPYNQELPNNQEVETGNFLRGINMTGNVLLLHMNEESGTIIDSSGNENNGTYNGALYSQEGKLNTAIGFDGSNSIAINPLNNVPSAFTISLWAKRDTIVGTYDVLLGFRSNYAGLLLYETGAISLLDTSGNAVHSWSSLWVDKTQFHHITYVQEGVGASNIVRLYFDGVDVGYSTESTVAMNSLKISNMVTNIAGVGFVGIIDELAIWNRSLSATEIQDMYKRGTLRLNLSIQTCSFEDCSDATWNNLGDNLTSPQNLSESNNQYLQYQFEFETDNSTYTPKVYNVTADYTPPSPNATLISPANATTLEGAEQTFTCNATANAGNLVNISLYHNATGTWHLNATNEVTGTENETSFTVSGLPFTTFIWNCLATDSNGLSSFADSNFILTTIADATDPTINSYEITSSLTSGETATIRANITDSSEISLVWFTINNTDGTLTNYTMSQEGSTDFYNTTFEVGKNGTWQYKVYANDSYSNVNDTMDWQSFSASSPTATPQNEIYPTYALPSSSIVITADLSATDLLKEINATLNTPSGFQFPFSNYNQTQEIGNFSALQTQTARWFVFLPNTETTHTFNVTWTDKYNNSFQGSNKEIIVTYDSTNLTNTTNVNTIAFTELEAGDVLEFEIQVRDINGYFVNTSSVKISLYDPNDNLVVDAVNFVSQLGTGRYFYNYTTPSTPTGQWLIYVNVTRQGNSFIDREYFRLTGGPFDVRGITITDATAPTLGISVILENMGEGVTDIVVDWNLTRTDTGALLDSGQDTIGVTDEVTHTIIPETSYIGEAQITFLGTWSSTEKAGAQKTFTIISPPSSDDGNTGGNSGGGGGGSITGRATEEIVCNPPYIRYGKECCLDANNNSICDKDEVLKSPEEKNETGTGETGQEIPSKEHFYLQNIINKLKSSFESSRVYVLKNKVYFIFGAGAFGFIVLIFLIFRIVHKTRQTKKRKKKGIIEINHIKNIQVYAGDGKSIGKVKEAHLKENKIDGWLIKVKKNIAKKIGKKYILVKHNHVSSIGDVMIIDKTVSEHLERYSTPSKT